MLRIGLVLCAVGLIGLVPHALWLARRYAITRPEHASHRREVASLGRQFVIDNVLFGFILAVLIHGGVLVVLTLLDWLPTHAR